MPAAHIALRNLGRNRRRTAIALAAIAFGVAAFTTSGGFIEWILLNFREYSIHSLLGHAQIIRPTAAGETHATAGRLLADDAPAMDIVQSTAHVRIVAPRLSFEGLVSNGDASLSFVGDGVVPEKEVHLSRTLSILEGSGLSSSEPNGVLVGEGLAKALGAHPGTRLVLLVNTAQSGINAVEVTVRGIFASVTKAYDDSALRVTLPLARQLLRVEGSDVWVVLLDRTENTDSAVAALRAELPAGEYEIRPWHAMADFYNKTVALYRSQLAVVRTIIAIIIVLSISNTMAMSILERTSEIGTVLALGTPRHRLLLDFLIEALMLGIVGTALGIAVGAIVAAIATWIGIPMPPSPGMRHGFTAGILMTWPLAAQAALLGILPTVVAALYPAWKATRLPIVDALRYNR